MSDATLARTPLHARHAALGAKLVPFAGFEMPVQYPAGITAEHHTVRTAAGLFDVSHMGEFWVRGPAALELVQRVTTNDASTLAVGQAQYSALLDDRGAILDDLLVYRFEDAFLLVVNASNREKDFRWIVARTGHLDATLEDASDEMALLALQGPRAEEVLGRLGVPDLDSLGYYRFREGEVAGTDAIISRTGYTGEDGFELFVSPEAAPAVWDALLAAGADLDVAPAGLGARDSLRLEMGYALYGNDLDDAHTPLEAGLGWIVKLDKGDFIGRDALLHQKDAGVPNRLVGFRLRERGFPRHGYGIVAGGRQVGVVTSGVLSPTMGQGIGMGYVPTALSAPGTELGISIRDRVLPAVVIRPPFHKTGSVRS